MQKRRFVVLAAVALMLAPLAAAAAEEHEMAGEAPGAAYVRNVDFVGGRAVQLAEAIPEEDYGWRPMEGVRSVGEAILHIAGANYFFAGRLGTEAPEGVDTSGFDSITGKSEIVATLEASLDHLETALAAVEDPGAEMEVFGQQRTVEDLMQIAVGHVHEHFGQLIAYARSNGVVPPWSQSEG